MLVFQLTEAPEIPNLKRRGGTVQLRVDLVRYSAMEFLPVLGDVLNRFEQVGITVYPALRHAGQDFVSSPSHHTPRLRASLGLLAFGALFLGLGLFFIVVDYLSSLQGRASILANMMLTALGAACIVVGPIGIGTSLRGMRRRDDQAVDLVFSPEGITVRGGHEAPSTR